MKNLKLIPEAPGISLAASACFVNKEHLGCGWRYAMVVNDGVIEKWFERPGINDTQADNDPYGETDPDRIAAHAYLPSTITPRRCELARLIQFNAQTDRP